MTAPSIDAHFERSELRYPQEQGDPLAQPCFQDLAELAAQFCGAPIAAIRLLDAASGSLRSRIGMEPTLVNHDHSFCQATLQHPDRLMVIADATRDVRFADHPLVVGAPRIRAYAGVALVAGDQSLLGTLAVADSRPRAFSPQQMAALRTLGRQVVAQIELSRQAVEQTRLRQELETARLLAEDARAVAESIAQSATAAVYLIDLATWDLIYLNQTAAAFLGEQPASAADEEPPLFRVVHPEDRPFARSHFAQFGELPPGDVIEFEQRLRRGDGVWRWMWHRETVFRRGRDGAPAQILGTALDITERKLAEATLRASEERFQTAIEAMSDGLVVHDREGKIVLCNRRAEEILGLTAAQLAGLTSLDPRWRAIRPDGSDWSGDTHPAVVARRTGAHQREVLMGVHKADGTLNWLTVNAAPVFADGSEPSAVVVTFTDFTQRHRMEREALERAERDPLTHLLHHRAFHQRLEAVAPYPARSESVALVAVFDTDNFKFFNDTYGHGVGDEVLCNIAGALRGCLPEGAEAGRLGGDEFAILIPRLARDQAPDWIDRTRSRLAAFSYTPPGESAPVPLRLSMGVVLVPDDAPTMTAALAMADARSLQNKTDLDSKKGGEREQLRLLIEASEGLALIEALLHVVDIKDRYTRRHSERVALYALQIARELGLSDEQTHSVQTAGLIHDVGKVCVPARILRRPGVLTDEEREVVRGHAAMGALLLATVPSLAPTREAVRHHHEHWDGSGYPDGLAGEAIPLAARILAVADAYSAMTMDRPYRRGLSHDEAAAKLRAGAGRQWDASCVAALLQTLPASP